MWVTDITEHEITRKQYQALEQDVGTQTETIENEDCVYISLFLANCKACIPLNVKVLHSSQKIKSYAFL